MSFTGTVENGQIKLPPGVHLPEGTAVTIVPVEESPSANMSADGRKTLFERLERFVGCMKDGPSDLAENHDFYAHGTPKGMDRR